MERGLRCNMRRIGVIGPARTAIRPPALNRIIRAAIAGQQIEFLNVKSHRTTQKSGAIFVYRLGGRFKAIPYNSAAALTAALSCINLDLPPVNLRFVQSNLTKNYSPSYASFARCCLKSKALLAQVHIPASLAFNVAVPDGFYQRTACMGNVQKFRIR